MHYGKLIHDFLDGSLGSTEEDVLFAEMSANQDARREFQLQTKLNSAIKKDMSLATTPVHATQAVFASLGFALTSNTDDTVVPVMPPVQSAGFWSRFYPHVLTAIASSVITILLLFWWNKNESDSMRLMEQMARLSPRTVQPLTSEITDKNTVKIMEVPAPSKEIPASAKSAPITRSFEVPDVHGKTSEETTIASPSISQETAVSSIQPIMPQVQYSIAPSAITSLQNSSADSPLFSLPDELIGITVQGRGISQLRSFPDLSDNSMSLPLLSNLSATVLYELSEHHSIGLEGGREVFHQDFTRESFGQTFSYRQSPSLWWYGAAYRYSLGDIGVKGLNPFGQVFAGWAQNGPIGKATAGIRYTPEQRISFILGVEGTYLLYPVGNTYFTTQKVGLTYGMSVNL